MLPLPITPETALAEVIDPALELLPERMRIDAARRMLVAIALQESGLTVRHQQGGPAHGLWQFEEGGGVHGVLTHTTTAKLARGLCRQRGVTDTPDSMALPLLESLAYAALLTDDILAAGFARLLLWTDPNALPGADDEPAALSIYLNTWRPGKPRPAHFTGNWHRAVVAVRALLTHH